MPKSVNDAVLDAALNEVITNATLVIACSAQPTTRAQAVSTFALADQAVTVANFSLANGDVSGRKAVVGALADVPVDADGTATHVAIVDAARLLYVTECTPQGLTLGSTVNFSTWDIEIADPV